jgi:hypothetical protein
VMSMPRYRPVVLAAACALALAAPAGAAYASTAQHAAAKPVLTIGKKGGPAVKKQAVLKASLPKGKSATFALGAYSATCSRSRLQAKVTANPSSRGKATLSLTGLTISHCKLKGSPSGISITDVKALNLPYRVTISSAKGFPVTIAGRSATKRLSLEATFSFGSSSSLTCVVTAPKVKAHASNAGNKVSAAKQKFTLAKSSPSACAVASSVTFSATYGPVRDTRVRPAGTVRGASDGSRGPAGLTVLTSAGLPASARASGRQRPPGGPAAAVAAAPDRAG